MSVRVRGSSEEGGGGGDSSFGLLKGFLRRYYSLQERSVFIVLRQEDKECKGAASHPPVCSKDAPDAITVYLLQISSKISVEVIGKGVMGRGKDKSAASV